MKLFDAPMFVGSLLGLCFLTGFDTPNAHANFIFGEPVNFGPLINGAGTDASPHFSADELSFYFDSDRSGQWEIWVTTRKTKDDPWDPPVKLELGGECGGPSISSDDLTLFFHSSRSGGFGRTDLWVATRAATSDPWGPPANLGLGVNSTSYDYHPDISGDVLTLYFQSSRTGGLGNDDIWMTTRANKDSPWGMPVNLGPTINRPDYQGGPDISEDGLMLLFGSGGITDDSPIDIMMTTRATVRDEWGIPIMLSLARPGSAWDAQPCISGDGSTLAFCSTRPDGVHDIDLWQAPVIPIVDLNGDAQVDAKDVVCMVSHWGTDDPLCDIGPMPWGDGFVDAQDLIVLSEHLFEDVNDPTLIAHWTLDETEGNYAHDGAGTIDAIILGGPLWQPTGGQVAGAIQLDGADDCVIASLALNPAKGPFSVLAWVKGGAPGQVVISEPGCANWLTTDVEGKLMTDLKSSGQDAAALLSQTVITDGQWHRIGLIWDGSRRSLYVDGAVAAEDTQSDLPSSGNGLYIGTGKNMEAGSFWSGLIDDVRIYSRAVHP